MSRFTRGFSSRGRARDPRLPPGQYDTGRSWPVLTAEATPKLDPATVTFTVEGAVAQPTTWTWDELGANLARLEAVLMVGAIVSQFTLRLDGPPILTPKLSAVVVPGRVPAARLDHRRRP